MKFCLIGEKLGHSYSEKIHRLRGLSYVLKEIPPHALEAFLEDNEFDGFNVTIPYKKSVAAKLARISERAKEAGAVNTVVKKGGALFGYNTDFGGLLYTFKRKDIMVKGKKAMILGSGGAAATAHAVLAAEGAAEIYCVSRKGELNYSNYGSCTDTDILVNATPVGMYPNAGECPVDLDKLPRLSAVVDCIYNPYRTELLMRAEKRGAVCSNGLPMLVEQALLAEDIWLGAEHEEDETEKIINIIKRDTLNIVLSGMPSCGKTTLGRLVAEKTGREFYDVDGYIFENCGRTPAEIINADGEAAFREIEKKAVKLLGAKSGAVIACGGGSVCFPENVAALKSNGVIVYIRRDITLLTDDDRPVSAKTGIKELFEKRAGIYESTADAELENAGPAEKCAEEIIKAYETACYKRT